MASVALAFCAAWLTVIPSPAHAQTGPSKGWCTVVGPGTKECFGDPQAACARQFQVYAGQRELFAYADREWWWSKMCQWSKNLGEALPTSVDFECNTDFVMVGYTLCGRPEENFEARDCNCTPNHGGRPQPQTPSQIALLDGAKMFTDSDFALADGGLPIGRTYTSRPAGAAGGSLTSLPLGFANWRLGLGMELHLGDAWTSSTIAGLATPDGGHYRFTKSGIAMAPTTSSAYPYPNTDFTLSFVGTWPGNPATLVGAKSNWVVTGPDDRTWYLESSLNPRSNTYNIARPVRMVEPGGLEYAFDYAGGTLLSITDSRGRVATLEWLRVDGYPVAISRIVLPDGTTLNYAYEALSTQPRATPARLVSVERRTGATVLDRTSYDYGDAAYPTFVTGVRDRDGALRWSVTYDPLGRATSSSGPGGTESFTVAYGAPGASFTRTVTNPLGKATVYTFARTSTASFDLSLTSVADQSSPASPAATQANGFDGALNLNAETDREGRVTGFTRDATGKPVQAVEAQGTALARTTGITWHAVRNTPVQVSAPGLTTADTLVAGASAGPFVPTYLAVVNFAYGGASQTYTAPAGASSVTLDLWGGAGGAGNGYPGIWSGAGGQVRATFAVAPGDVLTLEVGGGGQGGVVYGNGGAGGWPDGGSGSRGYDGNGGGGGSTRFYINGALMAVAGGGGGGGGWSSHAGAGGGETGQAATTDGGGGGTQTSAGVDTSDPTNANKTGRSLVAYPGAQRTGGWGSNTGDATTFTGDDGAGGGGGYWGGGGGGGTGGSGGGGSSWIHPSATGAQNSAGIRQTPARPVDGQPALAAGVASAGNGPAVAGGDGYAILRLK